MTEPTDGRPATARQIPAGAAQTYVYDPAARAQLVASTRFAATASDAPQWIHEHSHGQPCVAACGPLRSPARA